MSQIHLKKLMKATNNQIHVDGFQFFCYFRKALLVFPEDTKEFIEKEIEGFTELEIKVIGTCCTSLNKQKAQLLVNKRRKIKELNEDELLLEMSRKIHLFLSLYSLKWISCKSKIKEVLSISVTWEKLLSEVKKFSD